MHFLRAIERGDEDWTLTTTEIDGVLIKTTVDDLPTDIIELFDSLNEPLRGLSKYSGMTLEGYKMSNKDGTDYIAFKVSTKFGPFYGKTTLDKIFFVERDLKSIGRDTYQLVAEYEKAREFNKMIEICQKLSLEIRNRFLEIIKMNEKQLSIFGKPPGLKSA